MRQLEEGKTMTLLARIYKFGRISSKEGYSVISTRTISFTAKAPSTLLTKSFGFSGIKCGKNPNKYETDKAKEVTEIVSGQLAGSDQLVVTGIAPFQEANETIYLYPQSPVPKNISSCKAGILLVRRVDNYYHGAFFCTSEKKIQQRNFGHFLLLIAIGLGRY